MTRRTTTGLCLGLAAVVMVGCAAEDTGKGGTLGKEEALVNEAEPSIVGVHMPRLDGGDADLSQYKGQVVLIVNTASKCGNTPQLAGLESLYQSRKDKGFVVLGFPSNDFGGQEPLEGGEIEEFCRDTYSCTFPLFAKSSVRGEGQNELYSILSRVGGEPSWNFTKYLVDRSGRVVERFDPKVVPENPALTEAIDRLLAE